jgi:hypothetical protein
MPTPGFSVRSESHLRKMARANTSGSLSDQCPDGRSRLIKLSARFAITPHKKPIQSQRPRSSKTSAAMQQKLLE